MDTTDTGRHGQHVRIKVLMPGEIPVNKADVEELRRQHAEVKAVLGVQAGEKLEEEFRKAFMDTRAEPGIGDYHEGFYDGMRYVLDKITVLKRDRIQKEEGPF